MTNEPRRPRLTSLTLLAFQLNIGLQDGNHGLTFDDVYDGIDGGTLWSVIEAKASNLDMSLFTGTDQGDATIAALRDAAAGMRGRESTYGFRSGGLSLLMAFTIEAIQKDYWEAGSTSRFHNIIPLPKRPDEDAG
jgi:hypothetical protein